MQSELRCDGCWGRWSFLVQMQRNGYFMIEISQCHKPQKLISDHLSAFTPRPHPSVFFFFKGLGRWG